MFGFNCLSLFTCNLSAQQIYRPFRPLQLWTIMASLTNEVGLEDLAGATGTVIEK